MKLSSTFSGSSSLTDRHRVGDTVSSVIAATNALSEITRRDKGDFIVEIYKQPMISYAQLNSLFTNHGSTNEKKTK